MTTEILNTYVTEFMSQFTNSEELCSKWLSSSNQKNLKKLFKHPKDPSKPKRGKSGFLFFCHEVRPKLLTENEKMSVKEVVRELGRLWRELKSKGETEKYEILSVKDRERYNIEMKGYREQKKKSVKSTKTVAKTPKKTLPFQNYVKSKKHILKDKDPSLTDARITELLRERWDRLPPQKQEKYIDI